MEEFYDRPWGGHSIVKLKTTCKQKKSIFSKFHHQSELDFYEKNNS